MTLTNSGILVALVGTVLVGTLGFTEACSTEITTKVVEYGPLAIGSIMAWIGRYRLGGVTLAGFRRR